MIISGQTTNEAYSPQKRERFRLNCLAPSRRKRARQKTKNLVCVDRLTGYFSLESEPKHKAQSLPYINPETNFEVLVQGTKNEAKMFSHRSFVQQKVSLEKGEGHS